MVIVQCTKELVASDLRITLSPSTENGLLEISQVMADKPLTVHRRRIGSVIGRVSDEDLARIASAVAFTIGLSD